MENNRQMPMELYSPWWEYNSIGICLLLSTPSVIQLHWSVIFYATLGVLKITEKGSCVPLGI
jgi:hypothetical protein